jgi:cytochrome c oxidase subunit 2
MGYSRQRHRTTQFGVAIAMVAMLIGLGPSKAGEKANEHVIKIVAQRFQYTPSEITLKKGEPVTLEFTSLDFLHGFKVPALGVRANLTPGIPTLVHLQPDTVGRFPFLCDNFCGDGHEDMSGVFVVTE